MPASPVLDILLNGDFTDVLGLELLDNHDFSSWSGDNPVGWSVNGESGTDPEVSEVGFNEGHGGVGTGACNIYTTSANCGIFQTGKLVIGETYLLTLDANIITGTFKLGSTFASASDIGIIGSSGRYSFVFVAEGIDLSVWKSASPSDGTFDFVSVRKVLSPWIPSNDTDISGSNASFLATSDTDQTIIAQPTIALVEGATYRVFADFTNVTLDDPAAYYGMQLDGGVIKRITKQELYTFNNEPLYLRAGNSTGSGLEISSVDITTGDTLTIDNIEVYVEQFSQGENTDSIFLTGDIQVPDGGLGLDDGPLDEFVANGTYNGETKYTSVNSHADGLGGTATWDIWWDGSFAFNISLVAGILGDSYWEGVLDLITSYVPNGNAVGAAITTYGPTDHSEATGSAGLETDGSTGYVDLKTSFDYLNDLSQAEFGTSFVLEPAVDTDDFSGRFVSAEAASNGYTVTSKPLGTTRSGWGGAGGFRVDTTGDISDTLVSYTTTFDGSNGRVLINGLFNGSDDYPPFVDGDSTTVKLGISTISISLTTKAKFGFQALLDLTAVIPSGTWADWSNGLSDAINTAAIANNYDPHAIAAAIFAYDNNITGQYYALNELSSGDASDYYLLAYDITDSSAMTSEFYGLVSASGVTGTVLVAPTPSTGGGGYRNRYQGGYRSRRYQ